MGGLRLVMRKGKINQTDLLPLRNGAGAKAGVPFFDQPVKREVFLLSQQLIRLVMSDHLHVIGSLFKAALSS